MKRVQSDYAEQRMQQQWHDLVMAEQAGAPLEVLEQMYDRYILLAEEHNACTEKAQSQGKRRTQSSASIPGPGLQRPGDAHNVKKAS